MDRIAERNRTDMSFNIKEAVANYINGCEKKVNSPFLQTFVKAMFAGAFIGFGASGSSVAMHSIDNVGLGRLVAGVVFSVGLMMVILLGAELFTGDCLVVMAKSEKKITLGGLIKLLTYVYLGNFVGGLLLAATIYLSGQLNYSAGLLGAFTIKLAVGKVNLSVATAIASGILCNMLVSIAVLMAGCSKDIAGKLLVCFFVIMLFVVSGYEHCVANMYYISAGIIAKLNPNYVQLAMDTYGLSQAQIDSLNIFGFVVKNLIPVTIGNIIGGSFIVGLPVNWMHKDK